MGTGVTAQMMSTGEVAQMVLTEGGGRWAISIVLPGVDMARWPSVSLSTDRGVPTREDRARVLDQLGYELVTPGRNVWSWSEVQGHDDEEVSLSATARVRFVPGLADDPPAGEVDTPL